MSGGKNAAALLIASSLFWSVAACAAEYTLDFTCGVAHDAEAPVLRRAEMPAVMGTVPAVAVGDTLNLRLFGDVDYALRIVSAPPAGIAGQSFIAKDANGSASAIVKVSEKAARISVDDFMNRRQYTVRCKDGKVLIVERDNSQMDDGECGTCGGDIEVPQPAVEETKTTSTKKSRTLLGASGNEFPLAEQKRVVDILVAFDQGAKAWALRDESEWDSLEDCADAAIQRMNDVLVNTKVDDKFLFRLVGTTEVDGEYNNITDAMLTDLRKGAAPFEKIPALRDYYGADTVTLLVNVDENQNSYTTGIANGLYGVDSASMSSYALNQYGYNICHIQRTFREYTMAHETGHCMGCGHSNRNNGFKAPQSTTYSCGFHFIAETDNKRYRTVMGYNTADGNYYLSWAAAPYFSSPDLTPDEYGISIGTTISNNNRRVLMETCAGVSAYRNHVVPYEWDVRFLDENGNELRNGRIFENSMKVVLSVDSKYSEAKIYLTSDGTTPNTQSLPYNPYSTITVTDTTTLTASIVVDGVAQSVRSVRLVKGSIPAFPGSEGLVWETSGDYPWQTVSTTDWTNGTATVLHNYTFGEAYGADKVSYIATEIAGPKRLYFRHKSNFGSQSEGYNIWGRFSVVCEGGETFATSESSMTWRRDYVDIPSGLHRVAVVYSQGNYHYLDSGVWLDDLQLVDNPTEVILSPRDVASFNNTINVTLYTDCDGQTIYYTTDGSTPTAKSSLYTAPIAVSGNATIKAIAVDVDGKTSAVAISNYKTRNKGGVDMSTWLGDSTRIWSGSPQNEWGQSAQTYIFNYNFGTGPLHNSTWLGTLVDGPKLMEFTYKTAFLNGSSFSVTIDGEELMLDASGSSADVTRKVSIPAGTHDVRFVYGQNSSKPVSGTHGLFLKSVSFVDSVPLAWSGEAGQSGDGRWMSDSAVLSWNDSANSFENGLSPSVTFGNLSGNSSSTVTVKGEVVPGTVAFNATTTAYTFDKGDDNASITFPDANFSPSGNVTFNVPVKLEADSFTVAAGKTYAFNAPFGPNATSSSATFSPSTPIVVGAASTLRVAPGNGKTQTFEKFNNTGTYWNTSKFIIGEGTVRFTGDANGGKGLFGSLQLDVENGGNLVFEKGDVTGYNVGNSTLTIRQGGTVTFNTRDSLRRTVNFAGGSILLKGASSRRGLDLMNGLTLNVSADSSLDCDISATTDAKYVYMRDGSPSFKFSNNACLVNNVVYVGNSTSTGGIKLSGEGTYVQNGFGDEALTYSGATEIGGGMTLALNAEHENAGAYTVASGARLTGSGAITGDGVVTLDGSGAKLCGSLAVKNLKCASDSMFGDQWNPVSAVVTGSLSTKSDGAGVTVNNGYLAIGADCDVSGFSTANLNIQDAGLLLSNSLTVASVSVNNSTVTIANGAALSITGSVSLDCSKLRIVLDNPAEDGAIPMLTANGGFANIDKLEMQPAGYKAVFGNSTTQLCYKYDPNYVEYQTRLPVVDVLVAYDNGAVTYMGERSLEEFAQQQIDKMNDILATNKLDTCYSYRLAGVCKVSGTYDNIDTAPAMVSEGDGAAVTLRAMRELYGADTVTLLVNTSGATLGNSSPLTSNTDVAGCHDDAFSVCSIVAVDTGTQHTMIHENAHNMGCGHARAQSEANSPFSYGRGYYFMDGETKRHTIMAYDVDGTDVYAHPSPYFSTSSGEFGFTLGNADNDNARVLRETCRYVAQWRDSVKPYGDETMVTDEFGDKIVSGCVFKDSIKVTVAAPVEGATLYYTLDGSEPTKDNDMAWATQSAVSLNIKADKTLKVAYLKDSVMSPTRTVQFYKLANIPSEGLWQTSNKYPWTTEGDSIRSYKQTDYTYQCTTPLKATIVGPKRLSFKHKSYFGGTTIADNNYSHFDVLLDDSPVLTQTECTNSWSAAQVDIPAGTHEVTFVFSQRFAMNDSEDYKDGTPEADDAVWLKDIVLANIECAHSSTSDEVSWSFPQDATKVPDSHVDGLVLDETGITQTLDFGSTNAVVASVLAELPDGAEGALVGIVDARGSNEHRVYAYANGDGTFIIYYDNKAKTASSVKSSVLDVSGIHLWTLAYETQGGAKLYLDGVEVASDAGIKWTGNNNLHLVSKTVSFGSDSAGTYPIAGMKIFAVDTDFGPDNSSALSSASSAARVFTPFDFLVDYSGEPIANQLAVFDLYRTTGGIEPEVTNACVLRISEIMPKPTDAKTLNGMEGMDVNGLESGWVEVENTSDKWADLADYRFIRVNRGKKTDPAGFGNFPSRLVPPRSRAIFYTSERYSNSKDQTVSAFEHGTFDGKPMVMGTDLHNILVWGDKVNPKKSPYVRLYHAPGGDSDSGTVVDTVVIPSDLPEGWSIIVGDAAEGEGTRRWLCPTPTRGRANTSTDGLKRIGPNVGPLYEKKGQKKTDLANEFAVPTPPATPGENYVVTLPVNGVMNPDGTFTPRAADKIQSLKFVFRKDLDDSTLVTNDIDITTKNAVENWGDQYTATIPAVYFPAAGHLMQWKVLITDGEGVGWTSPSFNNPDDGYEWYGTIVEPDPATQMSAMLPTWHMFASGNHLTQMDVDADKQDRSKVPNQARVAIYDSSTSNYYDYVRIDLRGNTSAGFTKKGHGLRFAKSHPLTMVDSVTGEPIEEIRKTSLISEFADPSCMRQMVAFWLWKKMGNLVPFDFPVRCNLNGEFYQLAFNSERFTDELIEDVYGLDKYGYSYKNVGTLNMFTTAGGTEKKTPDDENETELSVLRAFENQLMKLGANTAHATSESTALTKFVVGNFDLPAWVNYLASARITQEMDDVWANVCAYYDNPDMKEGTRGTGTWMPLGYDFNVSLGQFYVESGMTATGLSSTNDWFKSHPLYGGWTVKTGSNGNNGFEAVLQSPKFRRLFLRRLRTLMDQELKEPGVSSNEVPFMVEMRKMADLMRDDAALDHDKWPNNGTDNAIDVWAAITRPATMDAGIYDIWDNYVVPRRVHLYVTHSVTNTAKEIGYGSNLNAGIPEAQSPIETLAPNISISNLTALDATEAEALGVAGQLYDTEVVVIRNDNDEVVDMSGWRLAFSVDFTFPAGTVCDANDSIYIVADRRAYIDAHDAELTDQVIVGNATFTGAGPVALYDADGALVYSAIPQTDELKYLRLHSFYGNTLDGDGDAGEWFTLTNISDAVTLDLAGVTVCFLKQGDPEDGTAHCHVTLENKKGKGSIAPLKSWTASQADYSDKGWEKIQNNKQQIAIYDKYGSVCQSLKVTQKNFPLAYGKGGYLVCDSIDARVASDSQWHEALPNNGGSSEPFAADSQEAADELVANAKPALSDDDITAGLDAQYLKVVAEPVEGSPGKYKAAVVANPETVAAPIVAGHVEEGEPVEVEEDNDGNTTVSVTISNAIRGLWYGYEVSDALGGGVLFENDVRSFERAEGTSHKVRGSPRDRSEKPSGFFRVKVLPAKPR